MSQNEQLDETTTTVVSEFMIVAGSVATTFIAGLLFCWLRLRSRSLLAPVIAHLSTNAVALVFRVDGRAVMPLVAAAGSAAGLDEFRRPLDGWATACKCAYRHRPRSTPEEHTMAESVYKIIELVGTSSESWEKAAVGGDLSSIRVAPRPTSRRGLRARSLTRERPGARVPRQGEGVVQVRGRRIALTGVTTSGLTPCRCDRDSSGGFRAFREGLQNVVNETLARNSRLPRRRRGR